MPTKEELKTTLTPEEYKKWKKASKYCKKHNIKSSEDECRIITKFSQLNIPQPILKTFETFQAPTPIQSASWPWTMDGRDIVGVAETGSGKTLAFSVPLINHLLENKGLAVVVGPTRELVMQIYDAIKPLAEKVDLRSVCVYGGASKSEQSKQLSRANIIIATPGRLVDFLQEGSVSLEKTSFLVLDEADRMLDRGFEESIKFIFKSTNMKIRQTVMFTATWPKSVEALAASFMKKPVKVSIGDGVREATANKSIAQSVEVMHPHDKEARLLEVLKKNVKQVEKILVFALYKKEASRIEGMLSSRGYRVQGIHGDLSQQHRTAALHAFKSGKCQILVATDVAARGLDIPDVKLVINLTFPLTIEDYIHRIGRTGRAGDTGTAITFFTEHDKAHSGALINVLKGADQSVPDDLLKFGTTVKRKEHSSYGAFFKDVDESVKAKKIKFDD